jgi:hypothetical protein
MHRVLLSRRRYVSSVSPPSLTGRSSVSAYASYLRTTRRRILGCRWSLSVSRLMQRRRVVLWRAYILMEFWSITVSRDRSPCTLLKLSQVPQFSFLYLSSQYVNISLYHTCSGTSNVVGLVAVPVLLDVELHYLHRVRTWVKAQKKVFTGRRKLYGLQLPLL